MIAIIDKEAGWTSNDVLRYLKKSLRQKKAGHEGTLDPFATGLLLVFFDQATKIIPYLERALKTYRATLVLGERRESGDVDGAVVERREVPALDRDQVETALVSFLGDSLQTPPQYSAKRVDGRRAYELARAHQEVALAPVAIHIESIKLIAISGATIEFEATVSRGTYIRSLGEDLACRLGTVGYLSQLRRVRIGDVDVENAYKVQDIGGSNLKTIRQILGWPIVEIDDLQMGQVRNGMAITVDSLAPRLLALHDGVEVALLERQEEKYKVERGLWKG